MSIPSSTAEALDRMALRWPAQQLVGEVLVRYLAWLEAADAVTAAAHRERTATASEAGHRRAECAAARRRAALAAADYAKAERRLQRWTVASMRG